MQFIDDFIREYFDPFLSYCTPEFTCWGLQFLDLKDIPLEAMWDIVPNHLLAGIGDEWSLEGDFQAQ